MALIYITGMPGTGKSTIREKLQQKGFNAYGGAEDDLAAFYNNQTGKKVDWVQAQDRTAEWNQRHSWKIPKETIEELNCAHKDNVAFLCAVTRNDKTELWDLFDKVIALTIDKQTLKHRLATRTNNDVGKSEHELKILTQRQKTAEQEYRQLGARLVDATQSIDKVVQEIIGMSFLK